MRLLPSSFTSISAKKVWLKNLFKKNNCCAKRLHSEHVSLHSKPIKPGCPGKKQFYCDAWQELFFNYSLKFYYHNNTHLPATIANASMGAGTCQDIAP